MVFQKKILKIYTPPPKNKLVVEKRIIDGNMRKVETYNGKVVRVYGDNWKLLEDRSGKLKITLPTPPLEPRVRQENKLDDTPPLEPRIRQENKLDDTPHQEDKPEESPILEIPSFMSTTTRADEKMMSGTGGLQIVPDDEVAKRGIDIGLKQLKLSTENAKEEKVEVPKVEEVQPPNLQKFEIDPPKVEDVQPPNLQKFEIDPPKVEDVQPPKIDLSKVVDVPKIEGIADSGLSQQLDNIINIQDISNKVDIPIIEHQKETLEIIKDIPKKTNIPKDAQETEVPRVQIKKMENRIEKLTDKKTEVTKAEQQKSVEIKENKNMVEELLEEYKREQWAKKRDFEKNIEDMARVASENKGQIKEISQQIEGVTGKVGEVEEKIGGLQNNIQERFGTIQERFGTLQERLGDMKKPVTETLGELCTGVDCIKTDLKKSQEYQQTLEKQLEGRFHELSERLQKLEEPTYVCDNCGQDNIRPLSSFCSNCGAPIHSWMDPETGNPISGWSPFWKRNQKYSSQE